MTDTAKKKTRTGLLFSEPPSGYGSSRDLRVICSLMNHKKTYVTLSEIMEDTGLGRTTTILVIRLLQEEFPKGYGMKISSSINGYQLNDTGVFDREKLERLISTTFS